MKLATVCFWFAIIAMASAIPFEQLNQEQRDSNSASKSWEAVKNFFSPVANWFRNDLPNKTPDDIANDLSQSVSDTVDDVKSWSDGSQIFQSAKDALAPAYNWFKDAANTIRQKTFSSMYDDVKDVAKGVDETVATWINDASQKNVPVLE